MNQNGEWENPAIIPLRIDSEEVYRCPRRPIKEDPQYWDKLLFYFGMYKKGHLPDPGSVSEQSNKIMQVFRIVDDIVADCVKEKAERERQRQAKGR